MTRWDVHVTGIIWQGIQAHTVYRFSHEPGHDEILAKAGDFRTVDTYEIRRRQVTSAPVRKWSATSRGGAK